jgi:gas vesicle protein
MPFDVVSFLVGVAAGALTGGLAAMLHGLESVADLQERVRRVTREMQRLNDNSLLQDANQPDSKFKMKELQRDLDEIHEEIRRMYKRTSR